MVELKDLTVDPEFETLIRRQTPEESETFERQMANHGGAHDPIMVWDDNGTYIILDGHHRYWFLLNHPEMTYRVEIAKEVHNRHEAEMWIFYQQKGKKNLAPFELAELALRFEPMLREEAKKRQQESGGDKKSEQYKESVKQNSAQPKSRHNETRDELARIAGVSHDTIDKTKKILAEGTDEQIKAVRSGEKSINKVYNEIRPPKPKQTNKPEEDEPQQERSEQENSTSTDKEEGDDMSANLTEEKKEEIIAILKDKPYLSDRKIGEICGVHHKTVGRYRKKLLEESGQNETSDFIDGAKLSSHALTKRINEQYEKMINPEKKEYTVDDAIDEFHVLMDEFMGKLRRVIQVRNDVVKGNELLKSLVVTFSQELKNIKEEI